MNKKRFKNILVVLGGGSGERAVSLDSGRACIKALKKKGYKVHTFDPKFKNFNLINKKKIDVIFIVLIPKLSAFCPLKQHGERADIPPNLRL